MLLEGLFLPLTTPFYGDGRLYLRKLEHNAERYSRTLAAGLAVLTPVGEPTRLSDEEHRQALKSVAEATARETVLLADISRDGVRGALDLAEAARFPEVRCSAATAATARDWGLCCGTAHSGTCSGGSVASTGGSSGRTR